MLRPLHECVEDTIIRFDEHTSPGVPGGTVKAHQIWCVSNTLFLRVWLFEEFVLTSMKHVGGLWMYGKSVFTKAKRAGELYIFGGSVLTTAKHVGGLYKFGGCVLTTEKRVERFYNFRDCTTKCVGGL